MSFLSPGNENRGRVPHDDDEHHAPTASADKTDHLCPKVHSLATEIYREFEKLVSTHGNGFLRQLMPLVVSALENLDLLYADKQELQMNLALTQEDQKHLLNEYEKEKSLRKHTETKVLQLEDLFEEERKVATSKIDQLESTVKTFEVKMRNMSEALLRSEERENELLKENGHLRSRYNDLLRHFTVYVERTRILTDSTDPPPTTSGPAHLNISLYLQPGKQSETTHLDAQSTDGRGQMLNQHISKADPELPDLSHYGNQFVDSAFDELTQDDLHSENGHDIKSVDSSYCTPHQTLEETSSLDIFSGVKKEVSNLIKENQDLVQTKNALNVVTSDLIGRIDDLTCENTRLTSERTALISHSNSLLSRIKDLEQECHRLRQELESEDMCDSICSNSMHDDFSRGEDESPPDSFSMRRHFSRVEMARVLSERNYYKEQLLDLQDTVRWTETLRAQKQTDLKSTFRRRTTLWTWFSKLFTPAKSRHTPSGRPHVICNTPPVRPTTEAVEALVLEDYSSSQLTEDSHSGPSSSVHISPEELAQSVDQPVTNDWVRLLNPSCATKSEMVRYKCHFRPLADSLTGFKLWCAVDTYHLESNHSTYRATLSQGQWDEFSSSVHGTGQDSIESTDCACLVWVCSVATGLGESTGVVPLYTGAHPESVEDHTAYSLISVYNMEGPIQVVDSFAVTSSTVLCMASIPANTPETQIHLSQSESYWNAIPLESISDELDTDVIRDESTTTSGLMDSLCWSIQSYPWSGRRQVKLPVTTHSCEWHLGGGTLQYTVERRRITPARSNDYTTNKATVSCESLPVGCPAFVTHSTTEPTVWLGCFNGDLYIHSAVSDWRTCLHAVHLPDAITQIRHFRGRVFVSLANGQLVVFRRHTQSSTDQTNSEQLDSLPGTWNLNEACVISCPSTACAIQPSIVVPEVDCIWSACRNQIRVIDAVSLQMINSFEVQSSNDVHIRHMCCAGKGVWIALRRLSMLQLYHVITHQHLQTVDLEPLIIGRLVDLKVPDKPHRAIRPSSIAVTCLATVREQLWIGTNLGLIIRFPFASAKQQSSQREQSTASVSLCAELSADTPVADISEIQVSRHQHAGAVRFVAALDRPTCARAATSRSCQKPGLSYEDDSPKPQLPILSGGRGYAYRGDTTSSNRSVISTSGHLVVWEPVQF